MAKQIKVIQCPQCGSTQSKQIKEDFYKCESCSTEYFLDNDDVNINVTHKVNTYNTKKIAVIIAGSVLLFFFLFFISICSSPRKTATYTVAKAPVEAKKENPDYYKMSYSFSRLLRKDDQAILFALVDRKYGERYNKGDERNGIYSIFCDPITGKLLKEDKLELSDRDDIEYRYFASTNKNYLILKKRYIYEINLNTLSIEDVTIDIFKSHSEFDSGIASAKFIYAPRGEGFVVMTNMGKELYYCPGVDKVYTKDSFFEKTHGFNTLLPGAKNVTYYAFTRKSDDYPDEILQLLRITYKYNNGGPEDKQASPRWYKHYAQWGIIYDTTPFKKQLIDKPWHRITDYADITPGRMYFSPAVLYHDNEHILIIFKANAAQDAPVSLQLLNTGGDIIWTQPADTSIKSENVIKTGGGFVINTGRSECLVIDIDGQNMKKINYKKESE